MPGSVPVLPTPPPGQLTLDIDLPAHGDAATAFAALLEEAGRLWSAGAPVAWSRLHRDTARRRVPLPTYPFERGHHIVYPRAAEPVAAIRPEPPTDESVAGRLRVMFRQILGAGDDITEPDFFELGGDSLAAVQLIALIEDAFAVAPPLDAVFDAPTVTELAKVVEDMIGNSS
jgi:acyl carrier protein